MDSLFPEMEKEIRDERVASRREMVQHARGWLGKPELKEQLSWLINHLMEHGPQTEHDLALKAVDEESERDTALARSTVILCALHALWLTRKMWRQPIGIHPGSGQMCYRYGLRKVHSPNNEVSNSDPAKTS